MPKDYVHWDEPAQHIISHLRRAAVLRRIDNSNFPDVKDVSYVNSALPDILADAHVFDMGHLLDENDPTFITHPACQTLYDEAKTDLFNRDLHLPFGNMLLVLRAADTTNNHGFVEIINVAQDEECNLFGAIWVWHVKQCWSLCYIFVIDNERVHGPLPLNIKEDMAHEARMQNAAMLLVSIAMLNRQGEEVQLDTLPPPAIIKPKPFEIPNPSVRVLRVDAPRLVYPRTYAPQSTGRVQAPHDRRAHWATAPKTGIKYWRGGKGIRVNGGSMSQVSTLVRSVNSHTGSGGMGEPCTR